MSTEPTELDRARTNLDRVFAEHSDPGCGPPEACEPVNDASRAVIRAMHATCGEAWLCDLNGFDRPGWQGLKRWIPDTPVHNFCADLVAPRFDGQLADLVRERASTAYRDKRPVAQRLHVHAIYARALEIGAVTLVWT